MIFKPKAFSMAMVAICSAGSVVAGGSDIMLMPSEVLFEKGNYAEVSVVNVSPNVTGTNIAPTGSMYKDYSAKNMALKMQASPKVSIGFADYLSAGIYLDYKNAGGSGGNITLANVDLSIKSRMLAAKYQFDDNFSAFAGLKRSTVKRATANVIGAPTGNLSVASTSDNALAFGVAYEKPEIALRVSALYQKKTYFSLPMTRDAGGALVNGTAGLPESVTIRFQSGIARDTLIYGSIHKARWGKSQIFFDNGSAVLTQKTTYTNSSSYTLGVARKLNEDFGLSATYGYEPAVGGTFTSPLATTNGKTSLSVGGKYAFGKANLSLGYSRIKVGDKELTGTYASSFTGNTTNVIAAKIGVNF
jgi:long-subunit fatty acid transport protein